MNSQTIKETTTTSDSRIHIGKDLQVIKGKLLRYENLKTYVAKLEQHNQDQEAEIKKGIACCDQHLEMLKQSKEKTRVLETQIAKLKKERENNNPVNQLTNLLTTFSKDIHELAKTEQTEKIVVDDIIGSDDDTESLASSYDKKSVIINNNPRRKKQKRKLLAGGVQEALNKRGRLRLGEQYKYACNDCKGVYRRESFRGKKKSNPWVISCYDCRAKKAISDKKRSRRLRG